MRGVGRRLGRLRGVAGRVAPRADAQLALQNLHRVELERQSRLQARLRGVRRGLEVARVQQGGAGGVARGGHARGTRLQLRVERLEQPAAQPRVLSDECDELGRGAALRLAVDVEAAPFVTLLDVAAGQVDAEHALLALGGDRVRRDLW